MNFFSSKTININKGEIMKEDFLKKESRYRKVFRDRWCVLTPQFLYTFENQGVGGVYKNPTETIEVSKIKTVKTDEVRSGNFFVS